MSPRKNVSLRLLDQTYERLMPSNGAAGEVDEWNRPVVSLALLDPNPDQPRKAPLSQDEIIALAESIKEHGLIQPIVTSPAARGRRIIIAGHRRKAAFQWLLDNETENASRWAVIPYIDRDTPASDRLVLALVENLSRQDLTEAEIIAGLSVLRDLRGWQQRDIARRLGVTEGWISKYFRVASDAQVSPHVQQEEFGVGKAYEIVIARSPEAKRRALKAALAGASTPTVRRVARGEESNFTSESSPADGESEESAGAGAHRGRGTADHAGVGPAAAAGVRDFAELADELGVTFDIRDTELAKLVSAVLEQGEPMVTAAAFLKLVRSDVRWVEGVIRSEERMRRRSSPSD